MKKIFCLVIVFLTIYSPQQNNYRYLTYQCGENALISALYEEDDVLRLNEEKFLEIFSLLLKENVSSKPIKIKYLFKEKRIDLKITYSSFLKKSYSFSLEY